MSYEGFGIEIIDMEEKSIREKVVHLLEQNNLTMDAALEYTIGVFDGEKLIATGSIKGNTLRCIAVDKPYQGGSVLNKLMSELIYMQYHRGVNNIFLFTKPSAKKSFQFMGFSVVEEIDDQVVLMENNADGLNNYLYRLSKYKVTGERISAIVMNGNPFTYGHRYLIEMAAKESEHLHVFVLSSDESSFPYKVRMDLIREGTKDIKNLTIHEGGNYIISNATFPSYFIKEKTDQVRLHGELDLKIFSKYIAPKLEIKTRYVGEEPYCLTTSTYNQMMKQILPQYGIAVKEIARKSFLDEYISASKVRACIAKGELQKIQSMVPPSTYTFLKSKEGEKVIKKIKSLNQRH